MQNLGVAKFSVGLKYWPVQSTLCIEDQDEKLNTQDKTSVLDNSYQPCGHVLLCAKYRGIYESNIASRYFLPLLHQQ